MMTTTNKPRIYVASLADYNAGRLLGVWIDATLEPEEIQEEAQAMLARSRELVAEEWAIHDYEGFGSYRLGEWESFAKVSALAQAIEKHGLLVPALLEQGLAAQGEEVEDAVQRLEEDYRGEFDTLADYVRSFLEESGQLEQLPEWAQSYIDFASYARDLDLGGAIFTIRLAEGGLHVFANR